MTLQHRFDGPVDAPVLVLGSSLGTSLEMWDPQVEALGAPYRLLRYNRRGHGSSLAVPGPATLDDLGGDVLALLDALGLERVAFCGLSLGGLEAMWLALHAPERVERLVFCCTAPSFPPAQQWHDRAAVVRESGIETIADAVLARWFRPTFHAAHPDAVDRFRRMLLATSPEGYAACCEAIAAVDLWPRIGEVGVPTLVLTGKEDPVATPASGARLRAAIPGRRTS